LLLSCLGGTAHQLSFWINSETLFRHTLAVTHDNGIAHLNLGVALEESGRADEALKEYQEAARLEPGFAQVHNNLGNLLQAQGRTAEALAQYREGLRLDPKAPMLHANVGTLLVQLGQFDEAMREYDEAARLAPKDPRPHYLMAKAWLRQNRPQPAVEQFAQALALDPNDVQTLLYLARLRAAYPDPAFRNGAEAVALAERANFISGEARPFVLDTLAMAYMEAERCADAQKMQSQAIERARAAGEPEQAMNELTSRLFSYQSCAPYRDAFTNSPSPRMGSKSE
jgi:tetratricopeptide (TPR) repeat protein